MIMDLEQVPTKTEETNLESPKKKGRPAKAAQKATPKAESKKLTGNIRNDVEILESDVDYVLYYLTIEDGIRPGTVPKRGNPEPRQRLVRTSLQNFWTSFAPQYTDDGRFINVNDAKTVIRLFNNIEEEHIEVAVRNELRKADNNEQEDNILDYYMDKFSVLSLGGSNKYIQKGDIVHCPGIEDLDVFPEECLSRRTKRAK